MCKGSFTIVKGSLAMSIKSMVTGFEGDFSGIVSEDEISVRDDSKVVAMLNVVEMHAFTNLMSSPKMTQWDHAANNMDGDHAPQSCCRHHYNRRHVSQMSFQVRNCN